MRRVIMKKRRIIAILAGLSATGCALTPAGTQDESDRASAASSGYALPPAERVLPELPQEPDWRDVLHRALLANGELEAAVHEWNAAVARIDQAASYPNSNAMVSFDTMFSEENVKAFDRTTFRLGFDTMENLVFPSKAKRAGEIALDEARASGKRARAAKFALQERVLSLWADYAWTAEALRVGRESVRLRAITARTSAGRADAGGLAQASLAAELELRIEENELLALEAELEGIRARLNGAMARAPDAELAPPSSLPEPRAIPVPDDRLLALAAESNPRLAAIAHEAEGRKDALELARLRWIPDVNPTFAFTGSVAQFLGAALILPTTIPEIKGAIREAEARAVASQAMLAQAHRDAAAELVATLVAMRDAERQAAWFADEVVPAAQRFSDAAGRSYSAGAIALPDVLEAQVSLLNAEVALARARTDREKLLARTESLVGVDFETLGKEVP